MKEKTSKTNLKGRTVRVAKIVLTMSARILIELIEQQEDLNFLYFHRYNDNRSVREARYDYEMYQEAKEERLRRQAIKRLCENKYIKMRKEGDRVVMVLTKSGKLKALQAVIRNSKELYFNNKICLVSYDFPEAARSARNVFRLFLKRSGFRYLQGSVWLTKKDVSSVLKKMIRLLKINHWVEVFVVEK
jgi:virulence-associated protein VapD